MKHSRPIPYNLEDIKRYRQGLMTKEEMHAFEKASMEDPFLADALEGYMQADMNVADRHLDNIKENITGTAPQKEKGVVVSLPRKGFAMWKVAAMVVVMAGAALLTYQLFNTQKASVTPPIAKVEPSATPATDTGGIEVNLGMDESATPGNKNVAATPKPRKINNTDRAAAPTASTLENADDATAKRSAEIATLARNNEKNQAKAAAPVANNAFEVKDQSTANEIRGRIVSPSNEPVANANITVDNSKKKVVTDNNGNFIMQSADTVVNATITTSGYANRKVQLKSNTDNVINLGNIVLQPDPSFENIAVVGLLTAKSSRVTDTTSNKPVGGWTSFKQHLANTLSTTVDTSAISHSSSEMELEFLVDGNGNPTNIKLIHGIDTAIDRQVIEAIKAGPKWASKNKRARLLITF